FSRDWSSDVCSSDLDEVMPRIGEAAEVGVDRADVEKRHALVAQVAHLPEDLEGAEKGRSGLLGAAAVLLDHAADQPGDPLKFPDPLGAADRLRRVEIREGGRG